MTTQPTHDEFKAARVLAERNDAFAEDAYQVCRWYRGQIFLREDAERALTAIRADTVPHTVEARPILSTPPPAIADSGKVRLGDGFISAEFPPLTEFQARLAERKEQRFAELLRRLRPWDRTRKPGCATMRSPDERGLMWVGRE